MGTRRSTISIKDFSGNEKKVYVYDNLGTPGELGQMTIEGRGVADDLNSERRVADFYNVINRLWPDTPADAINLPFARYFVVLARFHDFISVTGEIAGTGDGVETYFPHTCAYKPVVPNSITVNYTYSGSGYIGNDEFSVGGSTPDDSEEGTFINDVGGNVNYRTGYLDMSMNDPPDNGTDVTVDYDYFSTDPTNTNIKLTIYPILKNDLYEYTILGKSQQFTLGAIDHPSNYQYFFRQFADYDKSDSATLKNSWRWIGESAVLENIWGANSIIISVDDFNYAGDGYYSLYYYGV